jgi:uncharacterized damage-inducible protein DinB
MATISPEQAAFLLQYQLPSVKNEFRSTSAVIAAIPSGNAEYRPDPQSKTAAELAWHIAAAEHRFYGGIVAGAFDFNAIPRPEGGITPENISKWYEASFAKNFEALSRLTGEQAAKVLDFRGAFQMPAVAFLDFSLRHSIHHRGQLSAYLRASGGKVPAIYGESYDSEQAKKAAQAG